MQGVRRLKVSRLRIALLVVAMAASTAGANIAFATWNLHWFPSGRANRRMSETTERRHAKAIGEALGSMLESVCQTNGDFVLFLQEVRDEKCCKSLMRYAGREDAAVTSISKSNLNLSGSMYGQQRNIYLREMASTQVLAKIRSLRQTYGDGLRIVVAGDFNTDTDDARFISEATLRSFYGAHFRSCFRGLKPEDRVTHPASGPYPDATFDYILYFGFYDITGRYLFPGSPYSDHNFVAVTLR